MKQMTGKVGESIIEASKAENADLIIVGTRGMSKVRRTFLGSVSDYLVHHANVPVLVCRHKEFDAQHDRVHHHHHHRWPFTGNGTRNRWRQQSFLFSFCATLTGNHLLYEFNFLCRFITMQHIQKIINWKCFFYLDTAIGNLVHVHVCVSCISQILFRYCFNRSYYVWYMHVMWYLLTYMKYIILVCKT